MQLIGINDLDFEDENGLVSIENWKKNVRKKLAIYFKN